MRNAQLGNFDFAFEFRNRLSGCLGGMALVRELIVQSPPVDAFTFRVRFAAQEGCGCVFHSITNLGPRLQPAPQ